MRMADRYINSPFSIFNPQLLKHSACADLGEQLDQDRMLNTAIQNGSTLNALSDCLNATVYLRDHAALDDALPDERRNFRNLQAFNQSWIHRTDLSKVLLHP